MADQVSIYTQSVAEKCKKDEPLRLLDVDPDSDMPEWMGHVRVSANSGKGGYMKPSSSSKGWTNDRAVDEVQGAQKECRDSGPVVCR